MSFIKKVVVASTALIAALAGVGVNAQSAHADGHVQPAVIGTAVAGDNVATFLLKDAKNLSYFEEINLTAEQGSMNLDYLEAADGNPPTISNSFETEYEGEAEVELILKANPMDENI